MTEAKNAKLMDTEPGGENTQYFSPLLILGLSDKLHQIRISKHLHSTTCQISRTILRYILQQSSSSIALSSHMEGCFLTIWSKDPNPNEAKQQLQQQKRERSEQTAENIRSGEATSEHGFGGETVGNSGEANQGSAFGREVEGGDGNGNGQMRTEQGYGEGSGIGG